MSSCRVIQCISRVSVYMIPDDGEMRQGGWNWVNLNLKSHIADEVFEFHHRSHATMRGWSSDSVCVAMLRKLSEVLITLQPHVKTMTQSTIITIINTNNNNYYCLQWSRSVNKVNMASTESTQQHVNEEMTQLRDQYVQDWLVQLNRPEGTWATNWEHTNYSKVFFS